MSWVRTSTRWLAIALLAAAFWPTAAWAMTMPLQAVSFSDATRGYIAGDNGVNGTLSWTSDGGDSWHATLVPNRPMVDICASVDGVTALPRSYDGIFKSADSGLTWNAETPLFNPTRSVGFFGMAYLSGNRRAVVGRLTSQNDIALIASSVGGAPWAINFEGPFRPAVGENDPPNTYAELSAIDAVSNGNVAWAVGQDRTDGPTASSVWLPLIYKTVDGGSSWTTQTLSGTTPGMNCVAAVDTQTAFVGQEKRDLLRTTNGVTWTTFTVPSATQITRVKEIDAYDANHVLIVGDGGKIAWTSNATSPTPIWSSRQVGAATTLLGAQMITPTNWIVVGDPETILRTSDAGANWTAPTTPAAPAVAITTPTNATLLDSAVISIDGTSNDGQGIGVAKVDVRVQKANGQYWNGTTWDNTETWLSAEQAVPANGWDAWHKTVTIPDTTSVVSLNLVARATDGLGQTKTVLVSTSPPTTIAMSTGSTSSLAYGATFGIRGTLKSSGIGLTGQRVILQSSAPGGAYSDTSLWTNTGAGGAFSFSVKPSTRTHYRVRFAGSSAYLASTSGASVYATPKVYVRTPVAPLTMRRTRYYTVYGWLKPRHTAGTYPVRIYKWRKTSSGKWKSYGYVSAKASNYSTYTKYARSLRLSSAGKWRLQAYAPADSGHAATRSSGYDYVTVR